MTTTNTPTVENGATVFIPLNKLKKHPKNARKTPHSEASIEAKAASIAAKGILQNLVVEPEADADGAATGFYLVSIGEGRRQAQMLRVKRKEIKKTEPIRCVIDTANDAAERDLAQGRFSLWSFWMMRMRRIYPALAVVVVSTIVVGWFLTMPDQYLKHLLQALSALAFLSNFAFSDANG